MYTYEFTQISEPQQLYECLKIIFHWYANQHDQGIKYLSVIYTEV